jgi:hypothetical protein
VPNRYIHSTYGTARAIIRDPVTSEEREATDKELEELRKQYEPALRDSFIETDREIK